MRLTKRVIDAAAYHGKVGTAHYLWDDQLAGFGVRIYACDELDRPPPARA